MYCNHQPPKEFLSFPSTPGGGGGGGAPFTLSHWSVLRKWFVDMEVEVAGKWLSLEF